MASVSSVNGKKVSKLKFNDTIYDMGGSKNEPITITANGVYTAPDGVGYSPVSVSVPQVAQSGTVKNLLDNTKSCYNLFYNYTGKSVNNLISYSDTENVTNMGYMFYNCRSLTTIPQLDTSKVTNMRNIFANCYSLTSIPQIDTSSVLYMNSMFNYCEKLTTIPQLDTSNVTDMTELFENCSELTTIPQLNTNKVTNIEKAFNGCSKLTKIDITHMNFRSTSNTYQFAYQCFSLTKLIIRNMTEIPTLNSNAFERCFHFTGETNSTYNPQGLKDGRIYVPDDKVEALKTATNWSVYADIIVPLSTLVE